MSDDMSGMAVARVRQIGESLQAQGRSLESSVRAIDRLLALAEQNWRGPDVAQFKNQWHGSMRVTAQQVGADLDALGALAKKNADAQQQTSSTLEGAPGLPNTGGGGASGSGQGPGQPAGAPGPSGNGDTAPASAPPAPTSALDWVGDKIGHGLSWTKEQLGDIKKGVDDFVQPRVNAAVPALDRLGQAGAAQVHLFEGLLHGDIPQFTEVAASMLLVGGTGVGTGVNLITGQDYKLFDPGTPDAGEPVPTVHQSKTGAPAHPAVTGFDSFSQATMDVYDEQGVRVIQVEGADGKARYIVLIPGTEAQNGLDGIRDNTNGHNWSSNAWAMVQGSSATDAQQVRMAMEKAGIPPGSDVLFGAHSQGGIVATNLAADPDFASNYNMRGIITYGSPVECADLPANGGPPVLSIQHGNGMTSVDTPLGPMAVPQIGDIVPQLDLDGSVALPALIPTPLGPVPGFVPGPSLHTGDVTNVDLPTVGDKVIDVRANHDQGGYLNSLANASPENQQIIDQYLADNHLADDFMTGNTKSDVRVALKG